MKRQLRPVISQVPLDRSPTAQSVWIDRPRLRISLSSNGLHRRNVSGIDGIAPLRAAHVAPNGSGRTDCRIARCPDLISMPVKRAIDHLAVPTPIALGKKCATGARFAVQRNPSTLAIPSFDAEEKVAAHYLAINVAGASRTFSGKSGRVQMQHQSDLDFGCFNRHARLYVA